MKIYILLIGTKSESPWLIEVINARLELPNVIFRSNNNKKESRISFNKFNTYLGVKEIKKVVTELFRKEVLK